MPLPMKTLMEINASAKAFGPASGLKSSSWAGCLGNAGRLQIKPDAGYLGQTPP